jgi:hypothetical protein
MPAIGSEALSSIAHKKDKPTFLLITCQEQGNTTMQVNDQQNKAMSHKNDLNSSFKLDLEKLNGSLGSSISWLHASSSQEEWGEVSLDSMIHNATRCCIKKSKIWDDSHSSSLDKKLNGSRIEDSMSNLFLSLSLSQRSLHN